MTLEELETGTVEAPSEKKPHKIEKTNLLLLAVDEIEQELFSKNENNKREIGIVTMALNHIFEDVYRFPLSV